jgi:hypothetical protein
MPDGVAEALQPAERRLFGIRFGEAGGHRPISRFRFAKISRLLLAARRKPSYLQPYDRERTHPQAEAARSGARGRGAAR